MSNEHVEWTTDMRFPVGNGFSLKDVSMYIRIFFEESKDFLVLHNNLCNKFALSENDSGLAIERAIGGVVRALTTNFKNEPDSFDDPVANFMFHVVWKSMPTKGFLIRKKIATGKWFDWDSERRSTCS